MTDADLGRALGFTPEEALIAIPKLTREKRATYERMLQVADELKLWQAGLGPKPAGVIVTHERRGRR